MEGLTGDQIEVYSRVFMRKICFNASIRNCVRDFAQSIKQTYTNRIKSATAINPDGKSHEFTAVSLFLFAIKSFDFSRCLSLLDRVTKTAFK